MSTMNMFHNCAMMGYNENLEKFITEALLKGNIDEKYNGFTPFHMAIKHKNVEGAKMLLKNGADATNPQILFDAVTNGLAEIIPLLLKEKENIEIINDMNFALLFEACSSPWGNADTVKVLLEHGAKPNIPCKNVLPIVVVIDGIFSRSFTKYLEMTKVFIESGVDLNIVDSFGENQIDRLKKFLEKHQDLDAYYEYALTSVEKMFEKKCSPETEEFLRNSVKKNVSN
jgi:ankyrin repeat protein